MKTIILLLVITVGNSQGGVRVEIESLRFPDLRACATALSVLEKVNTWMDDSTKLGGVSSKAKGACFETLSPR